MKTHQNRFRKQPGKKNSVTANQLFALGRLYCESGDYERARKTLTNALRLDPLLECKVRLQFALIYDRERKWDAALFEADRALELNPASALDIYRIRSQCYFNLSRMDEYVQETRRILEIAPDPERNHQLLLHLNLLPETTPETLYIESRRWNDLYAAPLQSQIRPHKNSPDPDRRIRVGYLSPDLYNHAIMKLLPPVLERYDRSQFEVFVYAVGPNRDGITEDLERQLEHFVSLPLSCVEIAERVRVDEIDILVDLAGHSMPSAAYLAFAMKPAPIQVSWMGVLSTTGLSTMDYFLGGPHLPYPGTEHLFSETVYRLPQIFACYRPFGGLVTLAPSPYFKRGYITFGCFNHRHKITREAVKLWSTILHLVPGSRLLLKYKGLDNEVIQQRFRRWFTDDGISSERIYFEGVSPGLEYLFSWSNIDIALDPFPHAGSTTTLDALWMGVPVVSLSGRLAVQCSGPSILKPVGFPVPETPEQYVDMALKLAEHIPTEPQIRTRVRSMLRFSPLMDEAGFVQHLEAAYRDMWRTWCAA